MIDTRYEDPKDPNFPFIEMQATWMIGKDSRRRHRSWSNLYKPNKECMSWDGLEDTGDVYSIGSAHGVFSYVRVEKRGHVLREISGAGGTYGFLARITFNINSQVPSDIHTEECWLVERPCSL